MFTWLIGWLLYQCMVEGVRFNDRILAKKPMKEFGEVVDLKNLNKRQFIPSQVDWSLSRPLIRTEFGPAATLRNIEESETDAKAAVQGLTSYDGDVVVPPMKARAQGKQAPLDIDKMPDEEERGHGPIFDLFQRKPTHLHKETVIKDSGSIKENENVVKKEDEDKSKSVSKLNEETKTLQHAERTNELQEKTKKNDVETKTEEKEKVSNKIATKNAEIPGEKNFVCFLPKIVVKTRLVGTMVINEVKVYGDPRNEQSVHKFISTHVVSANATELVNEFILPPQFIIGIPPDLRKNNDVSIANTAIYSQEGQLDLSGSPLKVKSPPAPVLVPQPPSNTYVPRLSSTTSPPHKPTVPTYNPFLPTTKKDTITKKKKNFGEWSGDIISDIIQKKSFVKNKNEAKQLLVWLNNAARHRNAMSDIPGGDANAYTGYEMMPAASYLT